MPASLNDLMYAWFASAVNNSNASLNDNMFTYYSDPSFRVKVVSGAVTDASFNQVPPDGTLAVDSVNSALYVRINGAWKSVVLA